MLIQYSDITWQSAVFISKKKLRFMIQLLYSVIIHQPSVSCIFIRHMNTIKIYKHYNELRK